MQIGDLVTWNSEVDCNGSQNKVAKKKPDFLIIIKCVSDTKYEAVPCWIKDPGYSLTIFAKPNNIFVDARRIIKVSTTSIAAFKEYVLNNTQDAVIRIQNKNKEITDKKHEKKIARNQRRREAELRRIDRKYEMKKEKRLKREKMEKTYGRAFELATINNDRKKMNKIIKKVGYDPRPRKGSTKSGSTLKHVTNIKPCVGGRVSPR